MAALDWNILLDRGIWEVILSGWWIISALNVIVLAPMAAWRALARSHPPHRWFFFFFLICSTGTFSFLDTVWTQVSPKTLLFLLIRSIHSKKKLWTYAENSTLICSLPFTSRSLTPSLSDRRILLPLISVKFRESQAEEIEVMADITLQ